MANINHGPAAPIMRCRRESQVPKCFRGVKCPYPQAQTVQGEYGAISYSLSGPLQAELVVCMHGLNGSRVLFQDFGEYVSKYAGLRVLSFDLYGHGLSNAPYVDLCPCRSCTRCGEIACCGGPRGRYDLDFFVDQTDELLHLLGFGDAVVNLVGFSLGGTVAVAFAQRFPKRVARLVAMSPAGFLPKVPMSYYLLKAVWCCLIPLAPHVICTCLYKKERFAKSMKKEGHADNEVVTNLWSRFVWQLYVKRGVASATLAVCSRVPWFSLKPVFRDAGRSERPVLLIWGEKDTLNPTGTVAQEVQSCFDNSQLLVVPGAGHIAICDKPRQVVLSIMAFLQLPPDARMSENPVQLPAPVRAARPSRVGQTPPPSAPGGDAEGKAQTPASKEFEGVLPNDGGARQVASAAQMPVPMVLGHMDAGNNGRDDDIEGGGGGGDGATKL